MEFLCHMATCLMSNVLSVMLSKMTQNKGLPFTLFATTRKSDVISWSVLHWLGLLHGHMITTIDVQVKSSYCAVLFLM